MGFVTKLTKMAGIRHPIIQGGMHHVGFAPLAAAVSVLATSQQPRVQ